MLGMDAFVAAYGMAGLLGAVFAMAAGGFAKGVVGFALPLIGLSIAGSFLPYPVAVAVLIMPMLVSNLFQGLRQGLGPALGTLHQFWWLNLVLVVGIALAAQLVLALPDRLLFAILGVAICVFGASQLLGWQLALPAGHRFATETGVGAVAGFFGGLSGIWGPPIIMYFLGLRLPKTEMVRAQSLSFLLGALVLVFAHLRSGVLNAVTLPASAWMVMPTMAAMFVGYRLHDRLDQDRFTRVTLIVLLLSGLNLLRRAVA